MDQKQSSWLYKAAMLSISLVLVTGGSISAALPEMAKTMSGVSPAGINLIATIPQGAVIIFLVLSGAFVKKIGIKKTILLGLLIMSVAGIVPAFTNNYWLILVSRFVFGAGIGLYNALAVTIINLRFSGSEQSTLLGYRVSMESIGASVASMLVGVLLPLGWHSVFFIYLAALPIAFFFYRYVPEIEVPEHDEATETATQGGLDWKNLVLSLVFMILVMTQITIILQIPQVMLERQISNASIASMVVALFTFSGMIGGFLFGRLYTMWHRYALSIFLVGSFAGLMTFYSAHSLVIMVLGTFIAGVSGSLMCTSIFNLMTNVTVPSKQAFANTVILLGANVGSFAAPFGIQFAQSMLGRTAETPLLFFGTLIILVSIIFIFASRFYTEEQA